MAQDQRTTVGQTPGTPSPVPSDPNQTADPAPALPAMMPLPPQQQQIPLIPVGPVPLPHGVARVPPAVTASGSPRPGPATPFGAAMPVDMEAFQDAVVRQVEWYLGQQNLATDYFLQAKMDRQGWVSLAIISNFRKMQLLGMTDPFVLAGVLIKRSTQLEVDIDKTAVRPMPTLRTSTLILTDPSGVASAEEIKAFILDTPGAPYPSTIRLEAKRNWAVVYEGGDVAQRVLDSISNKQFRNARVVGFVRKDPLSRPIATPPAMLSPSHIRPHMPVSMPFYATEGSFGPGYPLYPTYPTSYPPPPPTPQGSFGGTPVPAGAYVAPSYPYAPMTPYGQAQQPGAMPSSMSYEQSSHINGQHRGRGGRGRIRGGPSALSRENYIPSPPILAAGTSDRQPSSLPNITSQTDGGSAPSTPTGRTSNRPSGIPNPKRSPSPHTGVTSAPASAWTTPRSEASYRGGVATPVSSPVGTKKSKRGGRQGPRDSRDDRVLGDESGWSSAAKNPIALRKGVDFNSSMFPPLTSLPIDTKGTDTASESNAVEVTPDLAEESTREESDLTEEPTLGRPATAEVLDISKITIESQTPEKDKSPSSSTTQISYAAVARRKGTALRTPPPDEIPRTAPTKATGTEGQAKSSGNSNHGTVGVITSGINVANAPPTEPSKPSEALLEPAMASSLVPLSSSEVDQVSSTAPSTNAVWANKPSSVLQATSPTLAESDLKSRKSIGNVVVQSNGQSARTVAQAAAGNGRVPEGASGPWKHKSETAEKIAQA